LLGLLNFPLKLFSSHTNNRNGFAYQANTDLKSPKLGADDALRYISEVFRILNRAGLFAVITTMPPKVFRAIAIDPIHEVRGVNETENAQPELTNWRNCVKKKIRTNEGGYVYFYIIQKTMDFDELIVTGLQNIRDNLRSKHTANSASEKGDSLFMKCFFPCVLTLILSIYLYIIRKCHHICPVDKRITINAI
jgi:hypothetical protein